MTNAVIKGFSSAWAIVFFSHLIYGLSYFNSDSISSNNVIASSLFWYIDR